MDASDTLLDGRELTRWGRLLASKYYTKIKPEGMRLRPMCWFSHWIDNSVSSSNIIDGGSQFIGKQWEHHIKTNGSKISKPMGARPWLLSKSYACSFFSRLWSCKVYWFRISLFTIIATMCWHCRHEWFWNWTNALVTTWMGDLFYESMGITQILQFTVLTNVDVNGSQIVKVYCYWTMKCLDVLSLWKMYFHLRCQRNIWHDSQTLF